MMWPGCLVKEEFFVTGCITMGIASCVAPFTVPLAWHLLMITGSIYDYLYLHCRKVSLNMYVSNTYMTSSS